MRVVILVLIVGGAIAFAVYRIATSKPQQAGPGGGGGRRGALAAGAVVPVSYDVATLRTMPISLTALGTVTAYNTVSLKSRVDGQIVRVNFQEGQRVRQGQMLIEIDPRPYQAVLAQAEGNLTRDQANAAYAQVQAQRYSQLYAAGVVSRESNQTQESTAGQAVGTLAADRAAIEAARVNLNYTRITSPINGVVGLRQVDIGNIVSAGSSTNLVTITQVQPIAVIFTLPEDQLPQVFSHMRGGHRLAAEAWDRSDTQKLATGYLLTVDNQIDTTTGTAKLKAVFENTDNALYPNQFVNIHLVLENRPNSLVIPATAIQTGSQGSFVYVVDRSKPQTGQSSGAPRTGNGGGSAAGSGAPAGGPGSGNTQAAGTGGGRRGGAGGGAGQTSYPVEVATVVVDSTQGPDVIIKSGIKAGDQVVTDGQERLQAGAHVVPHASADTAAARAAARGNASGKGKAPAAGNPAAGDFSNGRDSDRDTGPIPSTLRNGQNTGQGGRHRDGQGNAPSGGQGNGRPGGE